MKFTDITNQDKLETTEGRLSEPGVSANDFDACKEQIIKSEDKRFHPHFGIATLATMRAIKNDILAGSFAEGGSTTTQQFAKSMYFDFDKNFERKVAEVFVTFHLGKDCTTDEILEMHLNCIYFGKNCYGIKEVASHYYDTNPQSISKEENIEVKMIGEFPDELRIMVTDLCIFLSNTVKKAQMCDENRKLLISIGIFKEKVLTTIKNSVKEEPIIRDGLIETSKSDGENHGFGLRNISDAVKRMMAISR